MQSSITKSRQCLPPYKKDTYTSKIQKQKCRVLLSDDFTLKTHINFLRSMHSRTLGVMCKVKQLQYLLKILTSFACYLFFLTALCYSLPKFKGLGKLSKKSKRLSNGNQKGYSYDAKSINQSLKLVCLRNKAAINT